MSGTNNVKELAADQSLADGLVKHASDIPSLVLGTQTLSNAAMVQRVEKRIANRKAVIAARVAWLAAIATERATRADDRQFIDDLKQTLRARFSTDPAALGDFGLAARKRTKATAKTQVAAAAKAKATRDARGTKGAKQASEIHGNVTGVAITPVTAPEAAPAPALAPAPAPAPTPAPAPKQ